ncbi:hypothetical protein HYO65_gp268 [Tenacibaculum phage PTm1]|uniref:Uncharacterized protein n=2 Tax=Shirahamavirus PTm1 TaxID=2846435 RepID=A0A5S9ER38_9CAUD|nr:hypothetical protein HYO65_gp268 [Tenacibaculum phage PTm1]BBI90660.1 hypothetical protein [Tenacibaculum phage PTm1]BBI90965.1 hypothetical protein [Tenacibaculum phage PTm5]
MNKQEVKAELRSIVGIQLIVGTYSLTVDKVADKRVTITENINGFEFTHSKLDIISAKAYIEYKKRLNQELTNKALDVEKHHASAEYRTQLDSLAEIKQEFLFNVIDLIESNENNTHNILFNTPSEIDFEWSSGERITIKVRDNEDRPFITLSKIKNTPLTKEDTFPCITFGSLLKLNNTVGEEFTSSDTQDFHEVCLRYKEASKQLVKYTRVNNIETIPFGYTNSDIIEWFSDANDSDFFSIPLSTFEDRIRFIRVTRVNRVKTLIEVVSTTNESEIIEYETGINKFSGNFTDNIDFLRKLKNTLA